MCEFGQFKMSCAKFELFSQKWHFVFICSFWATQVTDNFINHCIPSVNCFYQSLKVNFFVCKYLLQAPLRNVWMKGAVTFMFLWLLMWWISLCAKCTFRSLGKNLFCSFETTNYISKMNSHTPLLTHASDTDFLYCLLVQSVCTSSPMVKQRIIIGMLRQWLLMNTGWNLIGVDSHGSSSINMKLCTLPPGLKLKKCFLCHILQ